MLRYLKSQAAKTGNADPKPDAHRAEAAASGGGFGSSDGIYGFDPESLDCSRPIDCPGAAEFQDSEEGPAEPFGGNADALTLVLDGVKDTRLAFGVGRGDSPQDNRVGGLYLREDVGLGFLGITILHEKAACRIIAVDVIASD